MLKAWLTTLFLFAIHAYVRTGANYAWYGEASTTGNIFVLCLVMISSVFFEGMFFKWLTHLVQVPLPSTQPQAPQQPSPLQQANVQVVHSKPSQAGPQEQPNVSQAQLPIRKQPQSQPSAPMSSTPVQGFHSQPAPSQLVEQPRGHMNPLPTQLPHPQASQVSNMPSLQLHSGSQPPAVSQPPMQHLPSHLHQPMQTGGVAHHALQPPLPPQPRPMQVPYQPAMSSNLNFPNAGIPHMPHSQPMFHVSLNSFFIYYFLKITGY